MSDNQPSFALTPLILDRVASISEKVGRITSRKELENKPHLRRNNRIRSIHASLKIEANSLSLSEVRDVINGHPVIGDRGEIMEVRNAYKAYDNLRNFDPFSIEDLKLAHGYMTTGLVDDSGMFRRTNEGVFRGDKCIFLAPPPWIVSGLMKDLFQWMCDNRDSLHPLILSAVFHYEFVFIHPFSDGNGRMARLWHTLMLYNWKSIFEYIPLESRIEQYQESYYNTISLCHSRGNSTAFIEFMLDMIDQVLDEIIRKSADENAGTSEYVRRLLEVMEFDVPYTAADLLKKLGLKSRDTLRMNYLKPAIELEYVRMSIPEKPQSRNQRYIRIG